MNRKSLLEVSLSEEKNVQSVLSITMKADEKFLKRTKQDLNNKLEDLEEKLINRLSSTEPLDKAVVEVLFGEIKELEQTLALYDSFEKKYLNN